MNPPTIRTVILIILAAVFAGVLSPARAQFEGIYAGWYYGEPGNHNDNPDPSWSIVVDKKGKVTGEAIGSWPPLRLKGSVNAAGELQMSAWLTTTSNDPDEGSCVIQLTGSLIAG